MILRTASVIVCDEILFSLTGKGFLQGVYTSDITIPSTELIVAQLVFFFSVETAKENPFKKIILKVTPPKTPATELEVPLATIPQIFNPNRPKMIVRVPMIIQQVVLRPGKIETKVITEGDELDAGGIWITSTAS